MAKPEWGTKRTGPCGTKFYDFNKSPIICPSCGGEVITKTVKNKTTKIEEVDNLQETEKHLSSEAESQTSNSLDSGILDSDINLDEEEHNNEHENSISSSEELNLVDDENEISLDIKIDEDENN